MRIHVLTAILALGITTSFAEPPESPPVVQLSCRESPIAAPGSSVEVAILAEVAKGWHINADKPRQDYLIPSDLTVESEPEITVLEIRYPPAAEKKVAFEESPLLLYEGQVSFQVTLQISPDALNGPRRLKARLAYQACNDEKCLPPSSAETEIELDVTGHLKYESNSIGSMFEEKGFFLTIAAIFVAGILLNLTPCVYPMIPITIAIFAQKVPGRARVLPAVSYFLGIVVTYSLLGTVAGLTGGLFGAILQDPRVLVGLAALMIYLAAAMFGWVAFEFPALAERLGRGGGTVGAFGLGATMGLVAAPCIGPFVVGLLAYVGSRRDAIDGFLLFGVLSSGLGLPYLVLGILSGRISSLPKSGQWMNAVKVGFGFVLIAMAVYFVAPLLSDVAESRLYAATLAAAAVTAVAASAGKGARKIAGAGVLALALLAGAWHLMETTKRHAQNSEEFWIEYDNHSFNAARAAGRPVLLDFYAEWCAPCKKLDRETWSDPDVRRELEKVDRLKVDLTLYDSPESEAVRRKFNITGVPTVIYFDAAGRERLRFEGYFTSAEFLLEALYLLGK